MTPARRRREDRAEESFRVASEAIGRLEPGIAVFALTRGQWSMIDAIMACLDQTGPAHLSVWTWRIADYETDVVQGLMNSGGLLSARMVIDHSAAHPSKNSRGSNLPQLSEWIRKHGAGSVRYVKNHAKLARIWNDRWRLLLRGSMNLNANPRFEQFDLSEGGPAFDLVTDIEDALPILEDPLDNSAVETATGIQGAWTGEQLALFDGARVWKG